MYLTIVKTDCKLNFTIISEKERELVKAQSEIKALRATEILNDKAVEEVTSPKMNFK